MTAPVCSVSCELEGTDFIACSNNHPIHKGCARQWALQKPKSFNCPVCRISMDASAVLSAEEIRSASSWFSSLVFDISREPITAREWCQTGAVVAAAAATYSFIAWSAFLQKKADS